MKLFLTLLFGLFLSSNGYASDDIAGFWTTIDDETKTQKSIVQIYQHQGKYFGRVVDLFNNKEAVAKLPNSPKILGLDIIWDLKQEDNKFVGGNILDPQKGKIYGCEIWKDGENLIVRGKIAFLGRNQTWLPNKDFKGNNQEIVPNIPVK